MKRISVNSSNIAEVGYDVGTQTLEVLFHNGNIYQYFDVPEKVYDGLVAASSVGAFFNSQIKGVYRFAKT